MRRVLPVLLALLAVAPAPTALAKAASFTEVEAALMCDTCNVPLNIAQSPRADQERDEIRRLIKQGKSKDEILDVFVAEYGPNVLADPSKGGRSAAVWAVPLAILLAAAASVAVLLPRWRRARAQGAGIAASDAGEALSDEDEDRLKRDLALYDL